MTIRRDDALMDVLTALADRATVAAEAGDAVGFVRVYVPLTVMLEVGRAGAVAWERYALRSLPRWTR